MLDGNLHTNFSSFFVSFLVCILYVFQLGFLTMYIPENYLKKKEKKKYN